MIRRNTWSYRHLLSSQLFTLVALVVFAPGCAAYQFGSASMFRSGIRTVHVPVVRNDTFRHDLGIRLTEALVKEIERRTPYKVTGDPNADSVLTCRVVNEAKRVLTENRDGRSPCTRCGDYGGGNLGRPLGAVVDAK